MNSSSFGYLTVSAMGKKKIIRELIDIGTMILIESLQDCSAFSRNSFTITIIVKGLSCVLPYLGSSLQFFPNLQTTLEWSRESHSSFDTSMVSKRPS